MSLSACPDVDDIEISLFGPGYGESVVIHIPGGDWVIIDSCIDRSTKSPAALQYLSEIGVDVSQAVKLIVASHWHDDHVRGLSTLVSRCDSAELCFSGALAHEEAIELSSTICGQSQSNTSGMDEFHRALTTQLRDRNKAPIFASEGTIIWNTPNCKVVSLSPSDYSRVQAAKTYKELLPKKLDPKKSLVSNLPNINHIAVALHLELKEFSMLLGSDLEESTNPNTGWSAVVNSSRRPTTKSYVFKIPHHGSDTGHSDDVWDDMLDNNALSLCTPYNKKVILPKRTDVERIYSLTDNAHITSTLREREKSSTRDATVKKTIREAGIRFVSNPMRTGQIRCRWTNGNEHIDYFNGANELRNHL